MSSTGSKPVKGKTFIALALGLSALMAFQNCGFQAVGTSNRGSFSNSSNRAPSSLFSSLEAQNLTAMTNAVAVPRGWDYGMTKNCYRSTSPSEVNYFQNIPQCAGDGRAWTVAVQAESSLGVTCGGVVNQSLPINTGGPLSMGFTDLGSGAHGVRMKADFETKEHPCGAGVFTWFAVMDMAGQNGGGPFPRPLQLRTSLLVGYNDWTPNGASRAFLGWQGYWNGKSHIIELNFAMTNWGTNFPDDPAIISHYSSSNNEFVALDGSRLGFAVPRNVTQQLVVDWASLIQYLIKKGIFDPLPADPSAAATAAVFVGIEVNNLTTSNSVVGDLNYSGLKNDAIDTSGVRCEDHDYVRRNASNVEIDRWPNAPICL